MKRKYLLTIITLLIISAFISSCTRSASGSPTDGTGEGEELPNPVSTQSQVMKDIIAGTKTAMAIPLDATEEVTPAEDNDAAETETTEAESTPEPEEEVVILPTSTPGPPPEIALSYNVRGCLPGYYICEVKVVPDQTITIQSAHPYLYKDETLTFTMGPEGEYDYSKYIVVGTAKYSPDQNGNNFEVTVNIPDALRGVGQVVVRLETKDPNRFGMIFFDN